MRIRIHSPGSCLWLKTTTIGLCQLTFWFKTHEGLDEFFCWIWNQLLSLLWNRIQPLSLLWNQIQIIYRYRYPAKPDPQHYIVLSASSLVALRTSFDVCFCSWLARCVVWSRLTELADAMWGWPGTGTLRRLPSCPPTSLASSTSRPSRFITINSKN